MPKAKSLTKKTKEADVVESTVQHVEETVTSNVRVSQNVSIGRRQMDPGDTITLHDFYVWKKQVDRYAQENNLTDLHTPEQVQCLRQSLPPKLDQVVDQLISCSGQNVSTKQVVDHLEQHIRSKRTVTMERVEFEECVQTSTETFEEFYVRVKYLAAGANLCPRCYDARIATRLISGLWNHEMRTILLSFQTFPTLDEIFDVCRAPPALVQVTGPVPVAVPVAHVTHTKMPKGAPTVLLQVSIPGSKRRVRTNALVAQYDTNDTVASLAILKALGEKEKRLDKDHEDLLLDPDGRPLKPLGRLVVKLEQSGQSVQTSAIFCAQVDGICLARKAAADLGIIAYSQVPKRPEPGQVPGLVATDGSGTPHHLATVLEHPDGSGSAAALPGTNGGQQGSPASAGTLALNPTGTLDHHPGDVVPGSSYPTNQVGSSSTLVLPQGVSGTPGVPVADASGDVPVNSGTFVVDGRAKGAAGVPGGPSQVYPTQDGRGTFQPSWNTNDLRDAVPVMDRTWNADATMVGGNRNGVPASGDPWHPAGSGSNQSVPGTDVQVQESGLCGTMTIGTDVTFELDDLDDEADLPAAETVTTAESAALRNQLVQDFADVFDACSRDMSGAAMTLQLEPGSAPFSIVRATPIHSTYRQAAKKLLSQLESQGVIAHVPDASDWEHPFAVVQGAPDQVRICADYSHLNRCLKRPPVPAAAKEATKPSASAIYFNVFQLDPQRTRIALDQQSQAYTTFLTPWGRYKYLFGPANLVATTDEYYRRVDAVLAAVPKARRIGDEIWTEGFDVATCQTDARAILNQCRKHKLALRADKLQVAVDRATLAACPGHSSDVIVEPMVQEALQHPKPANKQHLRTFLALLEPLEKGWPKLARVTAHLKPHLHWPTWTWNSRDDWAYEALKGALGVRLKAAQFDAAAPTALLTNVSRANHQGRYVLAQQIDGHWTLILSRSRLWSRQEEEDFSDMELEMQTLGWAITKCRIRLLGVPALTLVVQHQAVIKILDADALDLVDNVHLRLVKEQLGLFVYRTFWRYDTNHGIPEHFFVFLTAPPVPPIPKVSAREAAGTRTRPGPDADVQSGPDNGAAPKIGVQLQPNRPIVERQNSQPSTPAPQVSAPPRDQATTPPKGPVTALLKEDQVTTPLKGPVTTPPKEPVSAPPKEPASAEDPSGEKERKKSRMTFMSKLRARIQGTNSFKKQVGGAGGVAGSGSRTPPEEGPVCVFEDVYVELVAHGGSYFLIYADNLSGWPIVNAWVGRSLTVPDLIRTLDNYFTAIGVPGRLRTDFAVVFGTPEVRHLINTWDINHVAIDPQGCDDLGVVAVQNLKSVVQQTAADGKLNKSLLLSKVLEWRNTPTANGLSPSEMVFGCKLPALIQAEHTTFAARWQEIMNQRDRAVHHIHADLEQENSASPPPIKIGSPVQVQDPNSKEWDLSGVVVGIGPNLEHRIKLPSGRVYWRHRTSIRAARASYLAKDRLAQSTLVDDNSPWINSDLSFPDV